MKRIIGIIILALVFAFLIGVSCVAYGVKTALITWALGFLISLVIVVAIFFFFLG